VRTGYGKGHALSGIDDRGGCADIDRRGPALEKEQRQEQRDARNYKRREGFLANMKNLLGRFEWKR
jgi:hypothetical protein